MKKIIPFVLSLLGLLSSSYLFYRFIKLIKEEADSFTNVCNTFLGLSCDATLQDGNAVVLGLSWAGWGIIYFSSILLILGLMTFLKSTFEKVANIGLISLTSLGSLVSVILTTTMFFEYFPFCRMCLIIHLINFALLVSIIKNKTSIQNYFKDFKSGISIVLIGNRKLSVNHRWQIIALMMVLLFSLSIYQRLIFAQTISQFSTNQATDTKDLFSDYFEQAAVEFHITESDATIGTNNAPVQLVVFSDFECPYCASFAKETIQWTKDYNDKIQVVFKHYPLSSSCNNSMQDDMHPNACAAAVAAQAALQQGKFWDFHDYLFEHDLEAIDYMQVAFEMNLNTSEFGEDFNNSEIANKVTADINLANQLEVTGTPAVFLNGKAIKEVQPQNIQLLINEILSDL